MDREELEGRRALVDDIVLGAPRDDDHVVAGNLIAATVEHRAPGPVDEIGDPVGAVSFLARLQAHQDFLAKYTSFLKKLFTLANADYRLSIAAGLRCRQPNAIRSCGVDLRGRRIS
jgi:hypothetical protein